MAQKTKVMLIDDVDGSEATQTVTFAYQGVTYEIDLNDDHASALEESASDWIASARKVGASRGSKARRSGGGESRPAGGRDVQEVRAWLRAQGHTIADRGRIAAPLLAEYDKAH